MRLEPTTRAMPRTIASFVCSELRTRMRAGSPYRTASTPPPFLGVRTIFSISERISSIAFVAARFGEAQSG